MPKIVIGARVNALRRRGFAEKSVRDKIFIRGQGIVLRRVVSQFEFWAVESVWRQTRKARFLRREWTLPSMTGAKNDA